MVDVMRDGCVWLVDGWESLDRIVGQVQIFAAFVITIGILREKAIGLATQTTP
jgi:hypothetical protein